MFTVSNLKIEFFNGKWLIWKYHNNNYTEGTYYVLNNDGTIDLVIEQGYELREIKNINDVPDKHNY